MKRDELLASAHPLENIEGLRVITNQYNLVICFHPKTMKEPNPGDE